jgi:hypothetical protein
VTLPQFALSSLSQVAAFRGVGSGQLRGEQLQYTLRINST